MVRHIVWWTLKDQADGRTADENVWHIQQASAMLHGLPWINTIEVCNKVQPSTTVPANVVLTVTLNDMEALENYHKDPVHVQFAQMVDKLADSRNVIDYVVDLDPALAGMKA